MSFKIRFLILLPFLLVAGLVASTGCDRFLNRQGPGRTEQIELRTDALTCLRPIPDRISLWLKDELPAGDVNVSFDCLRTTVRHFEVRARGYGNSESLTSEALREYINEALPSDRQITTDFMGHLMKIKTVLLGGSAEIMTRPELLSILTFLNSAQDQVLGLTGKMKLILFQENPHSVTAEDLKRVEELLLKTSHVFLEKSHLSTARYDIGDLHMLASAFNVYLGEPLLMQKLMTWMPFTVSLKNLFMGRYVDLSPTSSWKEHAQWVTRGYASALTFYYRVRPMKFDRPQDYDEMIAWANDLLILAETSRAIRESSLLPMPEILDAANKFIKTGTLRTSLTPEQLQSVIPETICKAIANFIEGPQVRSLRCHEVEGISRKGLDIIRHEWSVWVVAQRQIHLAFQGQSTSTWEAFRQSMRVFQPEAHLPPLARRTGEVPDLIRSFHEWKDLMEGYGWKEMVEQRASNVGHYPTLWDPSHRMIIKNIEPSDVLGFSGMTYVNLYRSLVRLVLKGFGTPPPREERSVFQYTLSKSGLQRLETEFRDFGRAIRFLDPRTPEAASRTFLEASFFTPHGRGADSLNAQEIFEELNILVSAGGETSEAIYRLMLANNCQVDEFDALARHYLKEKCFLDVLTKNFDLLFGSVSGLRVIGTLKPQERKEFDENLLAVAYPTGAARRSRLIGFGEIRTLTTVLYYIEILRLVYDTDRNGKLSTAEVQKAAPRFKAYVENLIQQKLKQNTGARWYNWLSTITAEDAFLCLVFKQEDPGVWCLSRGIGPNLSVGLPELLKVLGHLKRHMPE